MTIHECPRSPNVNEYVEIKNKNVISIIFSHNDLFLYDHT